MRTRIITAVVGLALLVPVLWYSDTYVFVCVVALLALIGNLEMLRCLGLAGQYKLVIPQYVLTVLLPFLVRISGLSTVENPLFYLKMAGYLYLVYIMYVFAVAVFSHGKIKFDDIARLIVGCAYSNMGFNSLILLRDYGQVGQYIFLLAFIGAWMTDIFAYFCGRLFGRHKLIPDVSPHKTVEGSIGGVVFCAASYVAYGLAFSHLFDIHFDVIALAVFGVIISVVSQIGDLAASYIKREYGIKDYGRCFPGHGGVMDRFDSVIPVATILMILVYSYSIV